MARLELLASDQIEDIHTATLDLLERVGVKFHQAQALRHLESGGARIDSKTERVYFSESLVKEALRKAPRSFTWYSRDNKHDLRVGEQERTYVMPGYGAASILDVDGKRRPGSQEDLAELTRLVDALTCIDGGGGLLVEPSGIAPNTVLQRVYLTMIQNTTKCVMGYTLGTAVALDCIKMASIVAGGEEELTRSPLIAGLINNKSPFEYDQKMSEAMIEYSKCKLPLILTPAPMAGGTSPVTLAGTLVQQNAEALGGIILSQSVGPGTPNVYGSASSIMDMRTGALSFGSPETMLLSVAGTQLARRYGLPSRAICIVSDAKLPDAQAGYEKAMASMVSSLAGLNLSTWAGLLESGPTISPAQMVIDNEIWGMIHRFSHGIDVTFETLAVDVIAETVQQGSFLGHKHTLEFHNRERWFPVISDRNSHGSWNEKGKKSLMQRAAEEAKRIIATHQPQPLDREILSELEKIVKDR